MKVWTCQMAKHRLAKGTMVDITVKSGVKAFAPTWDMVKAYKDGALPENKYTECYYEVMRHSYYNNRDEWLSLMNNEEISLVCYCAGGHFCHRLLLVDILEKLANKHNIEFKYCGEIYND